MSMAMVVSAAVEEWWVVLREREGEIWACRHLAATARTADASAVGVAVVVVVAWILDIGPLNMSAFLPALLQS